MNPPVVLNQLYWCYALAFVAALPASGGLRRFVVITIGVLFVEWLVLKTDYWMRARGIRRTEDRLIGDRGIGTTVFIGSGTLITAVFLLDLWVPETSVWGWRTWSVADSAPATVVVLFAILPASSFIDWYFVRPRRDGIVVAPVCWPSGSDVRRGRMRLTKWILWHRGHHPCMGYRHRVPHILCFLRT